MSIFEREFFRGKSKKAAESASADLSGEPPKDRKEKQGMSRRDFLKVAGGGAAAVGIGYFGTSKIIQSIERTSDEDEDRGMEQWELRERAQALPSKMIAKEDFPMDVEKYSSYFELINRISTETTAEAGQEKIPGWELISIDMRDFKKVFFSEPFQRILQSKSGTMSYMNAISLTQAVFRTMERNDEIISQRRVDDINKVRIRNADGSSEKDRLLKEISKKYNPEPNSQIEEATRKILENIDRVKKRELFGPETNLILFCHKEGRFANQNIVDNLYFYFGGERSKILANEKGVLKCGKMAAQIAIEEWHKKHPECRINKNYLRKIICGDPYVNLSKVKTLYAIASCQGPTTILFSGHGSSETWELAQKQEDKHDASTKSCSEAITYRELGDALINSKNIGNINLIGATCKAYDFLQNLFAYLESMGIEEKPYVSISEANKSKSGWGRDGLFKKDIEDYLLSAMLNKARKEKSATVKVEHFFMAEGEIWQREDPAIMIGSPDQYQVSEKPFPDNLKNKKAAKAYNDKSSGSVGYAGEARYYLELGAVKQLEEVGNQPHHFA